MVLQDAKSNSLAEDKVNERPHHDSLLKTIRQIETVQLLNQQYSLSLGQGLGTKDAPQQIFNEHELGQVMEAFLPHKELDQRKPWLDTKLFENELPSELNMNVSNYNYDISPFEIYGMDSSLSPSLSQRLEDERSLKSLSLSDCDSSHVTLKREISEAFGQPSVPSIDRHLSTPISIHGSTSSSSPASDLRDSTENDKGEVTLPRRLHSAKKQLLTVEQKRLNHSHSEQKRRQLCKLAYERCLRLVSNGTSPSDVSGVTKKRNRGRQNSDCGAQNMSKHTALVRIGDEISKIQNQNKALRDLLA